MDIYTLLKHLHLTFVVLFLISVVIKLILLFTNPRVFEKYRAKTKLPEIISTALFLIAGIGLIIVKEANFHWLFWVKIALILAAIPLAIIGFKKQAKIPALLGTFLFIMIYGLAEMSAKKGAQTEVVVAKEMVGTSVHGLELYEANCIICHGESGDKKMGGASDLTLSTLTKKEYEEIITNGKDNMPKFSHLKKEELNVLVDYLESLKK